MEDIHDDITRHNVVEYVNILKERLKTTLKVFTVNYLDTDDQGYFRDNKYLNALRELCNKFAISKSDKGQEIDKKLF